MFFGIILGIILTVGAAYVYDSVRKTRIQAGIERPVVNWDVVNRLAKILVSSVQASWARLTGHAKDR